MIKRFFVITQLVFLLATGFAQNSTKPAASTVTDDSQRDRDASAIFPVHTLDFKTLDSPPTLTISSVMTFPSECTVDGALFLDMLDSTNPRRHTVVSIHGKDTNAYEVSAISDLNDITVISFFPSDDTVGFLVRASKEQPGPHTPGRSAAGIAWKDYHNFIAEFDRNGQYKDSIQLPVDYTLSRFAMLPSGEFIITGYDKLNSTVRLLFLKQSGEILRSLDMPSARDFAARNEDSSTAESDKDARLLLGSILFTRYQNDILVWRMNSNHPILDVGSGATVREVPLQPPSGQLFVDLVPATDRWIAHFRSETVRENAAFNQTDYSYYELNPQDGSISSKLVQSGDTQNSISCESGGRYIAFKRSQDNKIVILDAE